MGRALLLACALWTAALASAAPKGGADAEADAIRQVTEQLYRHTLATPGTGLGDAAFRKPLRALLTRQLFQLLEQSEAVQQRHVAAAAPDEKPVMIEGDLFVDSVEGAHEVMLHEPEIRGDRASVKITAIYIDTRFEKAHRHRALAWEDQVELRGVGTSWRISDVRYRGDPDRRLSALLAEFVTMAPP